ncbi:hypothetical protein C8J56DRAFT_1066808 [Mycena floridula]|nr:hypothetical protein C8J56DRAFT_1066808 [Mycena floridula]
MKLDSASLTSANAISIANFLPPKLTAIGTIVAVLVFTLLSQYHSPTKEFIIDVHEARDQFSLSVSDCRLHYYRLFYHIIPHTFFCSNVRAAKKDG